MKLIKIVGMCIILILFAVNVMALKLDQESYKVDELMHIDMEVELDFVLLKNGIETILLYSHQKEKLELMLMEQMLSGVL